MDAFSYLSVLVSLILGLAITEVLEGLRNVIQARARLRSYWPGLLWAALVMVLAVQSWWAMYDLRLRSDWTFPDFAAVLAQTIVLYLLAALVLPEHRGEGDVDLRAHYDAQRRWFFSLLVLLIVASLARHWVLLGDLQHGADLAFHGVFALLGFGGIVLAGARWQAVLALAGAALIFAYIALLFMRLG